ncbi:hypothetical protein FHU40_005492 [Nocardioides soli]|uniref:Uncharacterized protein n=1 Tax=Nocardioides soli TaxID=1036020 RepID=A0A7W4Z429_9ACTN|nr:hypothetical protein [Nocardioides soli]
MPSARFDRRQVTGYLDALGEGRGADRKPARRRTRGPSGALSTAGGFC